MLAHKQLASSALRNLQRLAAPPTCSGAGTPRSRRAGGEQALSQQRRPISIAAAGPPHNDRGSVIGLPSPPDGSESFVAGSTHPFAEAFAAEGEGEASASKQTPGERAAALASSAPPPVAGAVAEPSPGTALTAVPLPTPSSSTVRPVRHPFNTHAFVNALVQAQVKPQTARALMEGVRTVITQRTVRAQGSMLSKEELDNEGYLFKAALSKLRTEFNVRNRNTGIAARNAVTAVRRELDSVEQKMAEDMQVLKHDIELEMNNRKVDTRTEIKGFDIGIEEINNRATISVGDLKTEIESAKWEATRRAITIIVVLVICGIGISTFSFPDSSKKKPKVTPPPPPPVRDVGIGTDDDTFDYEARIEKLLSSVPPVERRERRERKAKAKQELFVDRI